MELGKCPSLGLLADTCYNFISIPHTRLPGKIKKMKKMQELEMDESSSNNENSEGKLNNKS